MIDFHHACDQRDFEVAERLLQVLETVQTRLPPEGNCRRTTEPLVAALERLGHLRRQNTRDNRNALA